MDRKDAAGQSSGNGTRSGSTARVTNTSIRGR